MEGVITHNLQLVQGLQLAVRSIYGPFFSLKYISVNEKLLSFFNKIIGTRMENVIPEPNWE